MSAGATKIVGKLHAKLVHDRRVVVLAEVLAARLHPGQRVLDIGCGDGAISALLRKRVPGIEIQGVEFLARPDCAIPCQSFDGSNLPFPDGTFDVCMLVDVLHHTRDIRILLKEACRVSRSCILLKDHLDENLLDHLMLKLMDWVGNRPHGVRLTYNYQSRSAWQRCFDELKLAKQAWSEEVPLYLPPVSWIAGRHLHFIALLQKSS